MSTLGSIEQIVLLAKSLRLGRKKGETTTTRTMMTTMSGKGMSSGIRDRADKDGNRPRQRRLHDG